MLYAIIIILVVILFIYIKIKFRLPPTTCTCLVTGAVKTGKTALCVHMATHQIRKQRLKYYFKKYVLSFILFWKHNKLWNIEKPYLYSNIPLKDKAYKPITQEHLLREKRFEYESVIYLCECSLIADSQDYKREELNTNLLLFCKLIGHETKGGYLYYDTQSIQDLHYSAKRTLNDYIYITKTIKWIPFVILQKIRVERYQDTAANVYTEDTEDTGKWLLYSKRVWKKYDRYCYSVLTDDKPVTTFKLTRQDIKMMDLKAHDIITFNNKYKKYKAFKVHDLNDDHKEKQK